MISKIKIKFRQYVNNGQTRADRYLASRPHRSFRRTPQIEYKVGKKVQKVWPLIIGTFVTIWREKKILLPILLLYALAIFIFVGAASQLSYVDLRKATTSLFQGNIGQAGSVMTLFAAAVTGGLSPAVGQLQQFLAGFITFIFWLVIVWVLRFRLSGQPTTVREALYNSGSPIVPSVIVLLFTVFQLIPAALGIVLGALALSGFWIGSGAASMAISVAGGLLCLLSLYWVTSSLMALIIVTLPGMYPWRALSAASTLVVGQRWRIALRLAALGLMIFIFWAAVLIPMLLIDNWLNFNWLPLIPFTALILGAFTLVYVSAYIYKMYRSML